LFYENKLLIYWLVVNAVDYFFIDGNMIMFLEFGFVMNNCV